MVVLITCKNEEVSIKIEAASVDKLFPIISLWELSVAMGTRVLILSASKPNTGNPPPQ